MASKSLDDLHPSLKPLAHEFLKRAAHEGITVVVYCTYRGAEEQKRMFAVGRDEKGRIVNKKRVLTPNAAGYSAHSFTIQGKPAALAFDCILVRDGKIVPDNADCTVEDLALWKHLGDLAATVGLEWGGRGRDGFHHFQLKAKP